MVMMVKVTVISTMALSNNLDPGKEPTREGEEEAAWTMLSRKASSDFPFDMCCISELPIVYFYLFIFSRWRHTMLSWLPQVHSLQREADPSKTDEFSENFQTAFDPLPPHFRKIILQFFSEIHD